jgi:hypothetical protein
MRQSQVRIRDAAGIVEAEDGIMNTEPKGVVRVFGMHG